MIPRYGLSVTNKCNWHCSYCISDVHRAAAIDYSSVLAEAKKIPLGSSVSFGFGEPGMLPRRQLIELIDVCKQRQCDVVIMTNGLIFRKNLDLIDRVDSVTYHCVEYLKDDIEFPNLDQTKIDYNIILLEEDILSGAADNFLSRYPHIRFLISPDSRRNIINLPLFVKFYKKHQTQIHEDTLKRFVLNNVGEL